jgi:tetratricopeptide (TPR) repeat protein
MLKHAHLLPPIFKRSALTCLFLPPCSLLSETPRRAHYAAAQVHALTGDWAAAEAAYLRCIDAARAPTAADAYGPFVGQALFCVGTARARGGRHEEALRAYGESEAAGYAQPHALAQARGAALLALGRASEAAAVVDAALSRAGGGSGGAAGKRRGEGFVDMTPVLRDLRRRIDEQQSGGSASEGQVSP